jgi:hypothetical protein
VFFTRILTALPTETADCFKNLLFVLLVHVMDVYRQPAALAHAYQLFREAETEAKHRIGRHASGRDALREPTFSPA